MPTRGWLLPLVMLALALRLAGLGHWSLWNDEIATVQEAQHLFAYGGAQRYPVNYLLTAAAFSVLGDNAVAARLLPAVFGALTVWAVYLLAGILFGRATAVMAAALLSVHAYHLFWSQNARHYALLVLLLTLFLYRIYRARRTGAPLGWGWGLFLLAVLTHTTAVLALPAVLLLKQHRLQRYFVPLAVLTAGIIIACFAWEPLRTVTVDRLQAGRSWGGDAAYVLAAVVYYFNPVVLLLAWLGWRQVPDCRSHHLALWCIIPVAALLVFSFFGDVNAAYALFALPVVLVLAAAGITQSRRPALLALVALLALLPQLWWYYHGFGQRPRYREAARFLAHYEASRLDAQYGQGGLVEVRTTMTSLPRTLPYYLGTPVVGITADPAVLSDIYVVEDRDFAYLDADGRVQAALQARGEELLRLPARTPVHDNTLTIYYLPPRE